MGTAVTAARIGARLNRCHGGGSVKAILRRDRRCWICRRSVAPQDATRDHRKPRSHGGYDKAANFLLADKRCNAARGDLPYGRTVSVLAQLPDDSHPDHIRQALFAAQKEWQVDPERASMLQAARPEPLLDAATVRRIERMRREGKNPYRSRTERALDRAEARKRRRKRG